MQHLKLNISFVLLVFLWLVCTLTVHFHAAYTLPRYWRQRAVIGAVRRYSKLMSLDSIATNSAIQNFSKTLKSMDVAPYIIFASSTDVLYEPIFNSFQYDSGNLDVLLNHICNLHLVSKNSIRRLAAVSLDTKAYDSLRKHHPNIPSVSADFDLVKSAIPADLKNRDYIIKQLILLYRTRVCAMLASFGISFWMMQQDSIWLESFEVLDLEQQFAHKYLLFDVVGNEQFSQFSRMEGWICGSTFFVRANPTTSQFFKQLDEFTVAHQSPDSSIMTYLCGHSNYKCQKLPRWVISSSNYFNGNRNETPVVVQVDTGIKGKTKMEMFREANLTFRLDDGTCDQSAVSRLQTVIKAALPSKIRKNNTFNESAFRKFRYLLKNWFHVDPYNHKVYLTAQYLLV